MALLTQVFRNGASDALGASDAKFRLFECTCDRAPTSRAQARSPSGSLSIAPLASLLLRRWGLGFPFECSTASEAGPKAQSNHAGRSPAGRYRDSDTASRQRLDSARRAWALTCVCEARTRFGPVPRDGPGRTGLCMMQSSVKPTRRSWTFWKHPIGGDHPRSRRRVDLPERH